MKDMLHEAGIRNYTIWNVGNDLFGYYECDSIEKASAVQANSPINAKWDEYMQDVMVMTKDPVTGAQPLLKQIFSLNNKCRLPLFVRRHCSTAVCSALK